MFQLLLLVLTSQIYSSSTQDLKSIFHTPSRRNYDDFEILERANFGKDDAATSSTSPTNHPPKAAYANAQVLLRFGGDTDRGKCACGDVCQCKRNIPYVIPILTPIPYCYCAPPTQPEPLPVSGTPPTLPYYVYVQPPQVNPLPLPEPPQNGPTIPPQEGNVVDETTHKDEEIKNNNHPEILGTVELTNDVIQPIKEEDFNKIKCLKEVSNKLNPTEVSPNVKLVSLDLSKLPPPSKDDVRNLKECLIPYSTQKQKQKLLLTYPIFNKPKNKKQPPVEYSQSGYSYSGGGGYYSNPATTVIYRRPTILTIVGPQPSVESAKYVPVIEPKRSVAREENVRYVLVPVGPVNNPPTPVEHSEDCCCCSCAKYVGELNQKS